MKTLFIKYFLNIFLLISFLFAAGSGIVLKFLSQKDHKGKITFLSFSFHQWKEIHRNAGSIFLLFALIHLFLNFKWYLRVSKSLSRF